jgi:hypothetical protein
MVAHWSQDNRRPVKRSADFMAESSDSTAVRRSSPRLWYVACGVAIFAIVFAAVTNQAWEDYYITFRLSRNLVDGHGLVFQVGERVHTFTSPLGVLIPALGFLLTHSETLALWTIRLANIAAIAGAAALVLRTTKGTPFVVAAALAFAVLDSKTLSFATNGMETGIFVFFTAWLWHELGKPDEGPRLLSLAFAFAGLMWTRPDGVIPILAVLVSTWLFFVTKQPPPYRRLWWRRVFAAAGIGALLYAPWFFWAWSYYGSPVPNTIVAKSVIAPAPFSLSKLLVAPLASLIGPTNLDGVFGPIFFLPQEWRDFPLVWRLLARVAAFAWLFPQVPTWARTASFATLLGGVYLQHLIPFAWYFGPWTFLGGVALAGVVTALLEWGPRGKPFVRIGTATLILASLGLVAAAAQTGRAQSRWVETNGRKAIGLWLRDNAKPTDTVFLEPLGYVGYFSGLKMLDYPGLSAPEVTALVRGGRRNFGALIESLQPTWLVLRPTDINDHRLDEQPAFRDYQFVRAWDQRPHLDEIAVLPGRSALEYDAVYLVFKRKVAN